MVPELVYLIAVLVVAAVAGAIASVSGFGIGSLMTPLFTLRLPMKLAVAAVSVPHCVATGYRFWLLRKSVDRRLLWNFGLMSALGGLAGALLQSYSGSPVLTLVLSSLLIFTGVMSLTGASKRLQFHRTMAWIAGIVSGLLGGLVGNQGGIRSAAMLGFHVPREAFVATATAVGLIVDGARLPVYLATQGHELLKLWPMILVATIGAVIGTLAGARILKRIPEPIYQRVVACLLLALGFYMLSKYFNG